MPPRAKKIAAHEKPPTSSQGLVPPGKKVSKQKSDNNLNGTPHRPNGHHNVSASVASRPPPINPTSDATVNGTSEEGKMGVAVSHSNRRLRRGSDGSVDDLEALGVPPSFVGHTANGSPLKIDVNAAAKSAYRQTRSTLALAKTVITTCPLVDVIAMLILLLQLPTGIVTIVHTLFFAITFMPTSATTSLSNLPSVRELLADSAGGPTFPVILALDIVCTILFLMMMTPMQNITLDMAQAVVAIAFSGAAASKGGPANSIMACATVIGISHMLRWKPARQLGINLFWIGLEKAGLRPSGSPPVLPDYQDKLHTPPSWPRLLLGVHILVQGMVRLVRRYLLWRDALSAASTNHGKVDPETGTESALNTPKTTASIADLNADVASSGSTDGRPPGPSPASKDGKERISSNRKKKKHASQVRSQQPFWAAIASTKVTFLKEYEQSQVFTDQAESEATDNTHFASFKGGDKVWIKGIGPTEICFGASLMRTGGNDDDEADVLDAPARPFYVRVNGADWSSIKTQSPERNNPSGDGCADLWTGRIFGLTAYSPYQVEFVRLEDDTTICATNLITQPAPSAEQVTAVSTSSQSLRPSSPATTLKNSILAAEQQLESQRNKFKRAKKEHKAATSAVQKEVDNLTARLNSSGGNDDRQRQKIRQLEQSIKRAEEAAAELEKQIKSYGDIPEEDLEAVAAKKAAWEEQRAYRAACKKDLDTCKAKANRELAQVQAELSNAQQKHQRFQQREAKYCEQHDSLISATAQGQDAQARRFTERGYVLAQRRQQEEQLLQLIERDSRTTHELIGRINHAEAQTRHLQDLFARANSQPPVTPEGPLPGTRGSAGNPLLQSPFSTFQFSGITAPTPVDGLTALSNATRSGRGRSSSMLSNVSGFTDGLEDVPPASVAPPFSIPSHLLTTAGLANGSTHSNPLMPLWSRRKSSQGSGSASGSAGGSNNSSQRDPTSPPPQAKTLSILGSPISPLLQRRGSGDAP